MADKNKALEAFFKSAEKKFGTNAVMWLGAQNPIDCNKLSSGSLLIDKVLGGGLGYGRIAELYGYESSGKSTLALQFVRQCQLAGGTAMYVDLENALDLEYARTLGVDVNKVIFAQPTTAEEALDLIYEAINTGAINFIVLDSIAAMTPTAVLNGEAGDQQIGLLARLLSTNLKKLVSALNKSNCALLAINQIRMKVNTGFMMGNPETTAGGNALKFFASQRIELKKSLAIKEGGNQIGQVTKVKCVKNKLATPMQVAEVPLIYGKGFSAEDEIVDLGIEYGFIQKSGSWFVTTDEQRLQGKEAVKAYYKEHPDLAEELKQKVKEKLFKTNLKQDFTETLPDGTVIDSVTGEVLE